MDARIEAWLAAAVADAERRGLPELEPLLEGLARSTAALREAEARLDDSPASHDSAQRSNRQP
ncbi:MAG TPA: hypothetical protein VH740_07770 [Vicinamibacterales bacterium]|jgi:hypothetical protein